MSSVCYPIPHIPQQTNNHESCINCINCNKNFPISHHLCASCLKYPTSHIFYSSEGEYPFEEEEEEVEEEEFFFFNNLN